MSDLHFSWDGAPSEYPPLHRNMLLDIEEQAKYFTYPVVIVVTGDLVNKGCYSKSATGAIKSFFTRLKNILQGKFLDIFFVPGNHDKVRTPFQEDIASLIRNEPVPMVDTYETLLDKNRGAFSDYRRIVTEIYNIFGVCPNHTSTTASTYGVNILNIEPQGNNTKHSFCFISMNTALDSIGEEDYRNLRLGRKQIQSISELVQKNAKAIYDSDLTIVLAHHPVNWLIGQEENILQNKLLSPAEWNANLYLCGHVHQRDAISWHNAHHSLTTLMTGFGWPDAGGAHSEVHLYSTYILNLDLNSMYIYVRSTNDSGTFIPDFRFYGKTMKRGEEKIVYPIDRRATQPYIELGRANGRSPKALYLSESFVHKQQAFYNYLCYFQNRLSTFRHLSIRDFVSDAQNKKLGTTDVPCSSAQSIELEQYLSGNSHVPTPIPESLKIFFDISKDYRLWTFDAFLQGLCMCLVKQLMDDPVLGKKKNPDWGSIRCHIRYYAGNHQYSPVCNSYGETGKFDLLKPIKSNSLIMAAFEAQKPLSYIVNKDHSVDPSDKWVNFLTVIPDFTSNSFRDLETRNNMPYLSMGISCSKEELNDLLHLFEFTRIDKIVGGAIEEFLNTFHISIQDYIDYLKD